ncbi:uncharacterized protein LOC123306697 [Coccinella septempunctata]|uniref:uncharacterized protein LOC123306697 n=1 Tax=Coccinella septempunctata TaxID=41139 RepID=UPI001D088E1A|nr:uncharacterized protein LOC123306697 [Coccinella septempunctata]
MSEQGNSTKKKTLHNCNCCVYNCSSRKGKSRAIHFHKFPKEDASTVHITNSLGMLEKVDRRKEWIKRLLMGKPVTNNMRVYSLHFQDSDYIATGSVLQHMKLKVTAVPSRNLPERKFSKALNRVSIARRKQRLEKRSALRDEHINPRPTTDAIHSHELQSTETPEQQKVLEISDLNEDEKSVVEALLDLQFIGNKNVVETHHDKGVQLQSGDLIWNFVSTITSDKQLNSLTGIPNFDMLNNFVELITKFYPDRKIHKLSTKERIILVFMKLKMSIKFTVLSFLFRVSQTTVKNIFSEYIAYLANVLEGCIQWPSSEEI